MKILLLEDDIILAELIKEYLEQYSFSVNHVYNGEDALEEIYTYKYDLLIFDINVPQINGLSILEKFRFDGFTTPIIFITTSTTFNDFKKAYSLGASDFIRKPFELKELGLRINYIKKTFLIQSTDIIKINKTISFNLLDMTISKNNTVIKLPKKEAEIIRYFLLNKNRIISIDELIINIWVYSSVPSIATIRTYIKNLRKILNHEYLETVKGLGYILKI
ncbi:MAG: DNA-binding response regulator [Arcobacter sp.]|nr:DNA-binding response regulator [Arcobacter sp.]